MKARLSLLVIVTLLAGAARGAGDNADAVVGEWLTQRGDARIEIFKADGKYAGKVVWVAEPTYPEGDAEAGRPVHDRKNPDAAKRDRPMIGLTLLADFEYAGDDSWRHGTIYNPENGKTYRANLALAKDGSLKVRGFVGISLLGETTTWTRCERTTNAAAESRPAGP